MRMAKLKP